MRAWSLETPSCNATEKGFRPMKTKYQMAEREYWESSEAVDSDENVARCVATLTARAGN